MTPNKLPPLPEPAIEITEAGQTSRYFGPVQMHDYAEDTIALRQSQSLPAGAVADGPVFYVQRTYDCNAGEDRGEIIPTLPANLIGKRVRLVPVDEALQVDAREKVEAASGKVNGYLFSQRAIEVIVDVEIPEWMSRQPGIRVTITPEGATQPEQASEQLMTDGECADKLQGYIDCVKEHDPALWPRGINKAVEHAIRRLRNPPVQRLLASEQLSPYREESGRVGYIRPDALDRAVEAFDDVYSEKDNG